MTDKALIAALTDAAVWLASNTGEQGEG